MNRSTPTPTINVEQAVAHVVDYVLNTYDGNIHKIFNVTAAYFHTQKRVDLLGRKVHYDITAEAMRHINDLDMVTGD